VAAVVGVGLEMEVSGDPGRARVAHSEPIIMDIRAISPCMAWSATVESSAARSCLPNRRRIVRTSRGSLARRCASSWSSSVVAAEEWTPSVRGRRSRDSDLDRISGAMGLLVRGREGRDTTRRSGALIPPCQDLRVKTWPCRRGGRRGAPVAQIYTTRKGKVQDRK
jgi:hypothetical protein